MKWPKKPYLIAHRGGNLGEYENNLENFRRAHAIGYRFLETDVVLTADGHVMSYHGAQNAYMQRKSGLKKRSQLQNLTYEQICNLLSDNPKPPLLENLLNEFPDCFFSVDAKTWDVVDELANVINRCNAQDRVSVTSFNIRRSIAAAKRIEGNYSLAGLNFYRIGAVLLLVFPRLSIKTISSFKIKFLHVPFSCVNENLIRAARSRSIDILAWSVNDESEIKRLLKINVDGIISDDIKLLQKITQNHAN